MSLVRTESGLLAILWSHQYWLDGNRREGRVSNNKQSLPIHREIHQPGKESFFIVNNSKPYSLYKIAKSRLSYERVAPEQNKV